jgi:hypothetical protein
MKKLAILMVIGMALASTGFAQEHAVRVSGHFRDHVVVRGYVGPRVGIGFSYAPAPYVPVAPAYVEPRPYCPPVVGGVVVREGFVRGRAYVDRDGRRDHDDWRRFRR